MSHAIDSYVFFFFVFHMSDMTHVSLTSSHNQNTFIKLWGIYIWMNLIVYIII